MSQIAPTKVAETDVLVLGGGVGGCMAALGAKAADPTLQVTIVEKAWTSRSGAGAAGLDHLRPIFSEDLEAPVDPELEQRFVDAFERATEGICEPSLLRIVARESKDRVAQMERYGLPIRDGQGHMTLVPGVGLNFPAVLTLPGRNFKPIMYRAVKQAMVDVLNRHMASDLLRDANGAVVGATAFSVDDGTPVVVRARSTILTTGHAVRMYRQPTGQPYGTWECPYTTGDGHAMAFRVGAELTGMEFPMANGVPKDFSTSGWSGLVGVGGYLINSLGERFMQRYNPESLERAPRYQCILAILHEQAQGRGPCYVDLRHISDDRMALFFRGVANERPVLLEYFRARGIDLRKQPFEIEVSELQAQNGGSAGVVADEHGRTSVEGLYGLGDAQGGLGGGGAIGATIALVFGWRAGLRAAEDVPQRKPAEPLDQEVAYALGRLALPFQREQQGLLPAALEHKLGQIMAEYVGMNRSERSLRTALERLETLAEASRELCAADPHGLMKVLEAQNLVVVSQMMAAAALARTESRWWHRRADYPQRDDVNWRRHLILRKEDGHIAVSARPIGGLADNATADREAPPCSIAAAPIGPSD
jgi:succinate dehydrogenase/fumarate reductase flavoprotein subunit